MIYVSNHGGRALDQGRAAIDILPDVVDAVGGRATVILDGGVTRGTDVIKALARGVGAVAIGKLEGWALAADGRRGLVTALEILEAEIATNMALLGVTTIGQIKSSHICAASRGWRPHGDKCVSTYACAGSGCRWRTTNHWR